MRTIPILFRGEGAVNFCSVVRSMSSATYIVYKVEKCPCDNVILPYFSKFVELTKEGPRGRMKTIKMTRLYLFI